MQHVQGCSSQLSSRRSALNLTTADRTFKRGYTLVAHTGAEAISLSCINIYSNVSEGDSANWDSAAINLLIILYSFKRSRHDIEESFYGFYGVLERFLTLTTPNACVKEAGNKFCARRR